MRTTLKVLSIVAFICASTVGEGQASWAGLSGLKVGQKIQIIEMNTKKHTGNLVSVSDSAIEFTEGSAAKSLPKSEVRSVKLHTNRRLRNTLIGLGVGVGVGGAIGAAACSNDTLVSPGGCAAGMGLIGAAIGVPVGALIPTRETLYTTDSR